MEPGFIFQVCMIWLFNMGKKRDRFFLTIKDKNNIYEITGFVTNTIILVQNHFI